MGSVKYYVSTFFLKLTNLNKIHGIYLRKLCINQVRLFGDRLAAPRAKPNLLIKKNKKNTPGTAGGPGGRD